MSLDFKLPDNQEVEILKNDLSGLNDVYRVIASKIGFQLLQDNDGNMELMNNLYLQELRYWEQFTKRSVIPNSNQSELYFEEPNIEQFVERLETLYPEIEYVNHLMTHSWGQKVVRFYDLDGNLIEVGTPV
jgi:catechol 2,3-dioxygenase-like lactoylglutathione lyase family enzyme